VKLKCLVIKNLRSMKSAEVEFDDYTCLVGANGSGKSTVLCALNILFQEENNGATDLRALTREDFCQCDVSVPIEIVATFADLNAEAKEDLKEYVRQDSLVISAIAVFDQASNKAVVKRYGQRLGMQAFGQFFKAHGDNAKAGELKAIYSSLRQQFPDLPAPGTRDAMAEALKSYESARPTECQLLPSEDLFYGVSGGVNRLNKFIQWVFVPAVKDATEEQIGSKDTALGKLLARTVRAKAQFETAVKSLLDDTKDKYQQILDANQSALNGISANLRARLAEWAHPEASLRLAWQQDPSKSVRVEEPFAKIIAGEANFEGELVRFGHGFQRSYLLALLQELAKSDDTNAPRLILGCEEPELYQHPPQSRHLADVFTALSMANAQIVVSTHSPHFITGEHFESVRVVRRGGPSNSSTVRKLSYPQIASKFAEVMNEPMRTKTASLIKVHQSLQPVLNEMFFTPRLVLVEGLEDVAYLHSWLVLTNRWDAFRRSGCHVVPASGKSEMVRPAIIALGFEIPIFAIFDGDGDELRADKRQAHARDNAALLRLFGGDAATPFSPTPIWADKFVMWPENIGSSVQSDLVASMGQTAFDEIRNAAHLEFDNEAKLNKTSLYIGKLLTLAKEKNAACATLDQLVPSILTFAGVA
jgi:putative ATP-dependent endonuclease of the OLD family